MQRSRSRHCLAQALNAGADPYLPAAGGPLLQKRPHLFTSQPTGQPPCLVTPTGMPAEGRSLAAAVTIGPATAAATAAAAADGGRVPPPPVPQRKRALEGTAGPEQAPAKAARLAASTDVVPQPAQQLRKQQPATASPSALGTNRPVEVDKTGGPAGGSQPTCLPAQAPLEPPSPPRRSERAGAAQQEQAAAHMLLQLREAPPIVLLLLDAIQLHPRLTAAAGLTQRLVGEYAALRLRLARERRAELVRRRGGQ